MYQSDRSRIYFISIRPGWIITRNVQEKRMRNMDDARMWMYIFNSCCANQRYKKKKRKMERLGFNIRWWNAWRADGPSGSKFTGFVSESRKLSSGKVVHIKNQSTVPFDRHQERNRASPVVYCDIKSRGTWGTIKYRGRCRSYIFGGSSGMARPDA